eukprot:357277-Chlamydomonas_euryale.AAC.5
MTCGLARTVSKAVAPDGVSDAYLSLRPPIHPPIHAAHIGLAYTHAHQQAHAYACERRNMKIVPWRWVWTSVCALRCAPA